MAATGGVKGREGREVQEKGRRGEGGRGGGEEEGDASPVVVECT